MSDKPKEGSENSPDPKFEELIYKCLDEGFKFNKFPHDLEVKYLKYDHGIRKKRFLLFGVIGLLVYNLFLIGDKAMLPDIFHEALIIRVFVITPLIVISVIGLFIKKLSRFIDFIAGNLILLASVSIMYFLLITNNPNVNNYHTGVIVLIVVGNIVLRLRFRYAVFFTVLIFFLFVLTVNNIQLMNPETVNNSIMVLFTIVCFSLIGSYQIENENRLTYLNSLLRKIDSIKLADSNEKLKSLSITDGLTGMTNRRHFDASLEKEWRACCRSKQPLSLILIDIDYFKNFNDNYGHQVGDDCLKKVASELNVNGKRSRDIVARFGGEEFVVLLPETNSAGAVELAGQIRRSIEALSITHKFSNVAEVVTISLGIATLLPSCENKFSELVGLADIALYEAKNQGRNRVYLHPESRPIP